MVKRRSPLGSNEEFRVRLLVELLGVLTKSPQSIYGVRSVEAAACLAVNQEVWVRFPSDTLRKKSGRGRFANVIASPLLFGLCHSRHIQIINDLSDQLSCITADDPQANAKHRSRGSLNVVGGDEIAVFQIGSSLTNPLPSE